MFAISGALVVRVNVVPAVAAVFGQTMALTVFVVAGTDVIVAVAAGKEPVQYTGSEKVSVIVLEPAAPLALTRVGAVPSYTKGSALEAGAPVLVTTTLALPAVPGGVVKSSVVALQDVTVADTPPTVTVGTVGVQMKPVPVMVTDVPPAVGPVVGVIEVRTAAAAPDGAAENASW